MLKHDADAEAVAGDLGPRTPFAPASPWTVPTRSQTREVVRAGDAPLPVRRGPHGSRQELRRAMWSRTRGAGRVCSTPWATTHSDCPRNAAIVGEPASPSATSPASASSPPPRLLHRLGHRDRHLRSRVPRTQWLSSASSKGSPSAARPPSTALTTTVLAMSRSWTAPAVRRPGGAPSALAVVPPHPDYAQRLLEHALPWSTGLSASSRCRKSDRAVRGRAPPSARMRTQEIPCSPPGPHALRRPSPDRPEHPMVLTPVVGREEAAAVDDYVARPPTRRRSQRHRPAKERRHRPLRHEPVNGDLLPIWVADYVPTDSARAPSWPSPPTTSVTTPSPSARPPGAPVAQPTRRSTRPDAAESGDGVS